MIKFYCGINETRWNYYPVSPGKYGCVSPVMGASTQKIKINPVFVPDTVEIIQDSGAFCDGAGSNRLSFDKALDRQVHHANKYNYTDKISHRASYDLLIDEKWDDTGKRRKERWSEKESWKAVEETIHAAEYLTSNRNGLGLVLSSQGVTLNQYMTCTIEIIKTMNVKQDIFGLGGWCILGIKRNKLRNSFREIMCNVIPYISNKGVTKVHIWGMMYAPALGELLWLCDRYGIELSLDSSGPQKRPIFGQWGFAEWKDKTYKQPPTSIRGQERAKHVQETIKWLTNFRDTIWYDSIYKDTEWRTIHE